MAPDAPYPRAGYAASYVTIGWPAELYICQHIAHREVGVFLSGKNGRGDPDVKKRIAQCAAALTKELGEGIRVSRVLDSPAHRLQRPEQLGQNGTLLEGRRAIYERVLSNGTPLNSG